MRSFDLAVVTSLEAFIFCAFAEVKDGAMKVDVLLLVEEQADNINAKNSTRTAPMRFKNGGNIVMEVPLPIKSRIPQPMATWLTKNKVGGHLPNSRHS
ncbi:MAG: hypothetical protein ABJQ85_04110 [Rhizobiaceae bacterium]